jgi:TatD DNase family protein
MRLIDVHCHLEAEEFTGRLEDVLADARSVGVVGLITASVTPDQWALSLELARTFPGVACVVGVHPWYCREEDLSLLDGLAEAVALGAVGIGEAGLDTKIDRTPFLLQEAVFERQLATARDLNVPMVLHCRGAFNEMLHCFRKIGVPRRGGIMHNFTGSAEVAEQFMEYGFAFSLGGILTYRNSRKRNDMLRRIYPDAFLLETDSPDIPPVEAKERPNVPTNIMHNLRAAAEILELTVEEVAETTARNAVRIFGLTL